MLSSRDFDWHFKPKYAEGSLGSLSNGRDTDRLPPCLRALLDFALENGLENGLGVVLLKTKTRDRASSIDPMKNSKFCFDERLYGK